MSILDEGIIDFAGIEENGEHLVLSICDHLVWGEETDDVHLLMLQNKINSYLGFIESEEVNEQFDPKEYNDIIIRIISENQFSNECICFLNTVKNVIEGAGFGLEWQVSSMDNENY